ncbi:MAG: DUF6602 domain-containing protein [Vulcanimicrobiota bacterium]
MQENKIAGWRWFVPRKSEMIQKFQELKGENSGKDAQIIAENLFKEWLASFIPRRYNVDSGYIVSEKYKKGEYPYFNILIYDQTEAPELWKTASDGKKFRVIPPEFVYAIFEVRPELTPETAMDTINKLKEVKPYLERIESVEETYKKYLPGKFFMGSVFFEIKREQEFNKEVLNNLNPRELLRGCFGSIVLSGENKDKDLTCWIEQGIIDKDLKSRVGKNGKSIFENICYSDSYNYVEDKQIFVTSDWEYTQFAIFAVDIIHLLNNPFELARELELFGISWAKPKKIQRK